MLIISSRKLSGITLACVCLVLNTSFSLRLQYCLNSILIAFFGTNFTFFVCVQVETLAEKLVSVELSGVPFVALQPQYDNQERKEVGASQPNYENVSVAPHDKVESEAAPGSTPYIYCGAHKY